MVRSGRPEIARLSSHTETRGGLTRYHSVSRRCGHLAEDEHLRDPGNGDQFRLTYFLLEALQAAQISA